MSLSCAPITDSLFGKKECKSVNHSQQAHVLCSPMPHIADLPILLARATLEPIYEENKAKGQKWIIKIKIKNDISRAKKMNGEKKKGKKRGLVKPRMGE